MTDHPTGESLQKTARIAGFLYLVYLVTQIVGDVFIRRQFIVPGDAAATAGTIVAHEWLFRVGFISDIVAALLFLLAAWALYVLLRPVHNNLALAFLLLNLGGVVIQCINALNLVVAQLLLGNAGYLSGFSPGQLQDLAMVFINLHQDGFMAAQIFYGAWLLPLGWLVYKSGFLPRILGILLMIDCFSCLLWFFQYFLFPGYEIITYPFLAISFIAEVSLTLWLLVKGAYVQPGEPRAS
jgi:hypothetical protein